jgi:AmmeMemoRadiSam system protein A
MHPLVLLAKNTVENYIKERKIIEPPKDFPDEFLKRKAGVFVTIEKNLGLPRSEQKALLRGCIGTYLPTRENIAEETIYNAIAAATEDYRFGPIQEEELPYLSYTVYILSEPSWPVKDISELNPKKFGIIIKNHSISPKCGVLLPDLEGVDTVEQQISIACQKAGIDPTKEKIIIYKFSVEKFTDDEK